MPTYALLGATGSTGTAILRCLLSHPPEDLKLNLFVRSKAKLQKTFPGIESVAAFETTIIEGTPGDNAAIKDCLKGVDVIMACIGTNYSTYGTSLIYDTATAIINALESDRELGGPAYQPPTLIQLRSASLNPTFRDAMPWLGRNGASFCFRYIYEDLERACRLYESSAHESPKLLDYIFVDPPSIHDARGTTSTGYKLLLDGKQHPVLSYADLGAAFCEIAERGEEFAGKSVGVAATGRVNETWKELVGYMIAGAKGRIWG